MTKRREADRLLQQSAEEHDARADEAERQADRLEAEARLLRATAANHRAQAQQQQAELSELRNGAQTSPEIAAIAARGAKNPGSLTPEEVQQVCATALRQAPPKASASPSKPGSPPA